MKRSCNPANEEGARHVPSVSSRAVCCSSTNLSKQVATCQPASRSRKRRNHGCSIAGSAQCFLVTRSRFSGPAVALMVCVVAMCTSDVSRMK